MMLLDCVVVCIGKKNKIKIPQKYFFVTQHTNCITSWSVLLCEQRRVSCFHSRLKSNNRVKVNNQMGGELLQKMFLYN